MTPDPEFAARLAAARGAPTGPAEGPCPEPGEWAALVEGHVADERRPALEGHLTACEPCLVTLLGVEAERGRAAAAGAGPRLRLRPRRLRVVLAAAATLLVALGGYLVAARRDPLPALPATSATLEVAVARWSAAHPDLAHDVADLDGAERAALAPRPDRGAARARRPQGLVLDGRPRLLVPPVPGAQAYELQVADAEGRVVARATLPSHEAPWPADAPALAPGGEYVLRVEAAGPTGRVRAVGTFRTAGPAEVEAVNDLRRRLASAGPGGIPALLTARLLLRRTAYAAAEPELRAALADPTTAQDARALLDLLEARIGR